MYAHSRPKRALSLALIAAMLIVAVAAVFPITASADAPEFDDFSYQTLAALDLPNDDDTALRFLFTIGSLDYDEVGFVLSKTNANPTIGGSACFKAGTNNVYRSVTADGEQIDAPAGRFWVAIKLTGIPRSYFDGTLYVRPFVKDGETVRYGDASSLTVCSAAGHVHDVASWTVTKAPTLLDQEGSRHGECSVCRLDVVQATVFAPKVYVSGGGKDLLLSKTLPEILDGDHFYPRPLRRAKRCILTSRFSGTRLWRTSLPTA